MSKLLEELLSDAISNAYGSHEYSDQWAAADAALDAVLQDAPAIERCQKLGISHDDLISNRWVEIKAALANPCRKQEARL